MTVNSHAGQGVQGGVQHSAQPTNLADVVEVILDKGIVIDAYVRVSLVGIELLTIDARIVVASIDTYLRYAREVRRLGLYGDDDQTKGLPGVLGGGTVEASGRELTGKDPGQPGKDAELTGTPEPQAPDDRSDDDEREASRREQRRSAERSTRQRSTRQRSTQQRSVPRSRTPRRRNDEGRSSEG